MPYGIRQRLRKLPDVRLSLLGKYLIIAKAVKDLGVTFDPNIAFYDHILITVSSCIFSFAQINSGQNMFGRNTLMTIINTLEFSELFYSSFVQSNAGTTHLLKLQAVQNFAAWIISNTDVTPFSKDLRWLPVSNFFQRLYRNIISYFSLR